MKRHLKNVFSMLLVCLLAVAMLSACGSSGGAQGSSSPAPAATAAPADTATAAPADTATAAPADTSAATAAAAAPAAGSITLKILSWNDGTPFQPLWAGFTQANPEVKEVDWQTVEFTQYNSMLTTQIQSGSVADLFSTLGLSDPQLANLVSQNLVRPMDDLVENESDWPSVDIDWYKVNGKLYACPSIFGDVEAIFYNMDIFNKYGLTLPKTWADQDKIAQTLVQNGVAPYAVSASDESSPQYYFYCLLACTQPDFVHGFPGNGQKLTDQAIIDTAKLLQDECQQGYFGDDYLAVDANGSTLDLTNGKAAMKMDGEWVTTTLSALPSQNIGTYFPPDINGDFVGNGASPNQAVNFSIYANTPNMDASVKLVQYIMGPTVQQAFADAGSGVIYNCPKAQGINAPNPLLATLAQIEMKPAVSLVSLCGPISADGANPRNVMSAAVQDLFFNKVTPEEFAKQIDTCVDYSKIGQSPYTSSGS